MLVNALQFSNALPPIVVVLDGKVIEESAVHPLKPPTNVIFEPLNFTVVRAVQLSNPPYSVTLLGIVMLVSPVSAKLELSLVSEDGNVILVNLAHLRNAQ